LIPALRQRFNAAWTPAKYAHMLSWLAQQCGEGPQFRHCETPCFFPAELIDRMSRYGAEMVQQLLANPRYMEESERTIPEQWRVPNEAPAPLFVQADFGLDANLNPKLVEIQGFPSLYFYQPLLADAYCEAYGLAPELAALPGGLNIAEYYDIMRDAIVGGHDPETVVLTEIDPAAQKTRHDFVMTERKLGVRAVDIRGLIKRGNRLFYMRGGRETRVHRIYNRAIVDEMERRSVQLPFDFRDDLDVEWAGHPNWFFRLSKFSLPYLKHVAVPGAQFLDHAGVVEHPERYVLKPLYSFAGAGVIVGPTSQQLAAVPAEQRSGYLLQERIDFRPVVETPAGADKVEARIMYVGLRPVNTIVRMGRGAQMGVDFNKGMDWVGASAGFIAS
jgi:hypothetical protein